MANETKKKERTEHPRFEQIPMGTLVRLPPAALRFMAALPRKRPRDAPYRLDEFALGEVLGHGQFGQVFRSVFKKTGLTVALKKIEVVNHMYDQLELEMKLSGSMVHDHIIRLYDIFFHNKDLYFILEYASCGNVQDYTRQLPRNQIPTDIAYKFIWQLTSAIDYCHEVMKIVHSDLKPENLLLDENRNVKLTDFGYALPLGSYPEYRDHICGTHLYMAPEVVTKFFYPKSIDNWSIGVLLFEFLVGENPFDKGEDDELDVKAIESCDYTIPSYIEPGAAEIINGLLKIDYKARLPLRSILSHPTLAGATGNPAKPYLRIFRPPLTIKHRWYE